MIYTEEYDKRLKQIQDIYWMPHVGKDYPQAEKKLFVLGLRYWRWEADDPYKMDEDSEKFERGLVHNFVTEYGDKDKEAKWKSFNHAVCDLLLGLNPNKTDVEKLFCTIAKVNFIQNSTDTNVSQNENETVKSRRILNDMLKVLQPNHVLVCAKTVWNWIGSMEYFKEPKVKTLWVYCPTGQVHHLYQSNLRQYQATIKNWNL